MSKRVVVVNLQRHSLHGWSPSTLKSTIWDYWYSLITY